MVGRDVFLEVRVRLHGHDVFNGGEDGLDEAIIVCDVCELRVEDLAH